MNKEGITILARCVKCDGISEITFPSGHVYVNIECPLCKKESNRQVWEEVWVTDRDYKELHELCKKSLKTMTEDRDALRTIKRDIETNVDGLKKNLYYLQKKTEIAEIRQSKEDFLTQYVLNRADTITDMEGGPSAMAGIEAWNSIQESCKPETKDE